MAESFNTFGPHEIRIAFDGGNATDLLGVANGGIRQVVTQSQRPARTDCKGPETIAESFAVGTRVSLEFTLHKINWTHLLTLIGMGQAGGLLGNIGHKGSTIMGGNPIEIDIRSLAENGGLDRKYWQCVPEMIRLTVGPQHTEAEITLAVIPKVVGTTWQFFGAGSGDTTNAANAVISSTGAHAYEYGGVPLGCPSGGSRIEHTYNWSNANPDDTGPDTDQERILVGMNVTVTPANGLEYFDKDIADDIEWHNEANAPGTLRVGTPMEGVNGVAKNLGLVTQKASGGRSFDFKIAYPDGDVTTEMPTGHSIWSTTFVSQIDDADAFYTTVTN